MERKTSLQTTHSTCVLLISTPALRTLPTVSRCLNNQILKNNTTTLATTTSSLTSSEALHPWLITGFSDAESCFSLEVLKSAKYSTGFQVRPRFQINLNKKDLALLKMIESKFGVGKIYGNGEAYSYQVNSAKDLVVIFNHFDKYPLISQKWADCQLLKQANELIKCKEHLTINGLRKIVAIKASMNLGLSSDFPDLLTEERPDENSEIQHFLGTPVEPVARPSVIDRSIKDPNWLAGFVSGEACFFVRIQKSSLYKLGFQVQLEFQITQHSRDDQLMKSLENYLGCGKLYGITDSHCRFIVTKFKDLTEKIIPLFNKYPIKGVKANDLEDFKKAAELMKTKAHLTPSGLEQIRLIKLGMNRGRKD